MEDNWLSKQIAEEAKYDAWSIFDEDSAALTKKSHEDDCEREEVAQRHERRHNAAINAEKQFNRIITQNTGSSSNNSVTTATPAGIIIFMIMFIIFFILSFLMAIFL